MTPFKIWPFVPCHGWIFARACAQISGTQCLECYVTQQYPFSTSSIARYQYKHLFLHRLPKVFLNSSESIFFSESKYQKLIPQPHLTSKSPAFQKLDFSRKVSVFLKKLVADIKNYKSDKSISFFHGFSGAGKGLASNL